MKILRFREVLRRTNARRYQDLYAKNSVRSVSTSSRLWSSSKDDADPVFRKKYSDTLQLPKSAFPMKVPFQKRSNHDVQLAEVRLFPITIDYSVLTLTFEKISRLIFVIFELTIFVEITI